MNGSKETTTLTGSGSPMCRQEAMIPFSARCQALARAAAVPLPSGPGWVGRAIGVAETHRRACLCHTPGLSATRSLVPVWRLIPMRPPFPSSRYKCGRVSSDRLRRASSQVPIAWRTDRRDLLSRESGIAMATPISRPSAYSWPMCGRGRNPRCGEDEGVPSLRCPVKPSGSGFSAYLKTAARNTLAISAVRVDGRRRDAGRNSKTNQLPAVSALRTVAAPSLPVSCSDR